MALVINLWEGSTNLALGSLNYVETLINKTTLGEKVRGQAEAALWVQLHVTKIFDIN